MTIIITIIQCILLIFDIYATLALIEKLLIIICDKINRYSITTSFNFWIISITTTIIIFLNTFK